MDIGGGQNSMAGRAAWTEGVKWPDLRRRFLGSRNTVKIFELVDPKFGPDIAFNSNLEAICYNVSCISVGNMVRLMGFGANIYDNVDYFSSRWGELYGRNSIVAHDVFGGLYALMAGEKMEYMAPEALEWQSLGIRFDDFVDFLIGGDLKRFYYSFLWPGAEEMLAQTDQKQAISVYPPLFAFNHGAGGLQTQLAQKQICPLDEVLRVNLEFKQQKEASET